MNRPDRAIRSVAIAGGGIVGLSAAVAFAKALPHVAVTVVDMPLDPAALAERMPGTQPAIHRFHAAIGLDEERLLRAGAATRRIAVRYDDWSRTGASWYQFTGDTGSKVGSIEFHHLWARVHRAGKAQPWHRYAVAGRLAEQGGDTGENRVPHALAADYDYALRLDPQRYRDTLREMASQVGVNFVGSERIGIECRSEGGIDALTLGREQRIAADLFLDCAGPGALLANAADPEQPDWDDWSAGCPCDRLTVSDAPPSEIGAYDTVAADQGGWTMRVPLPGRTLVCKGWSARFAEQDREGAVELRPGRRRKPWRHNVLALGDAAISFDPVGSLNLHLAHRAILRALELLPGRDCHPIELAEFNRRSDHEAHAVRDFLGLLNLTGPFAPTLLPNTLLHILDQFERRGRLVINEESPLISQEWLAALIGIGVYPLHDDPLAEAVSDGQALAVLAASISTWPAGSFNRA